MSRIRLWTLVSCLVATSATASNAPGNFFFSPVPRWSADPETEEVCAAVRKECALLAHGEIDAEFGYDELYDASGNLVGLRMTRSTGCKPLDESLLLGQRRFKLAFHKAGQPDLDDTHLELAAGVDPDDVRIVKSSGTTLSMGCAD